MAESVRLSDASRAVVEALSRFDDTALDALTGRLQAAVKGDVEVERESLDAIETNQKILAGVLVATEQNLTTLQRLRERKAGNEWAL